MKARLYFILIIVSLLADSARAAPEVTTFAADPQHLWNRLYATLLVRTFNGQTYGLDEPDPLLWQDSKYLLTAPGHAAALAMLDEFLAQRGERLITDPIRRVLLQRDLWAIFDWASERTQYEPNPDHQPEVLALQSRLAEIIRRLAPTGTELAALPDNYAAAISQKTFPGEFSAEHRETPFLPAELFRPDGPWVCLDVHTGDGPTAPLHMREFHGHSTFLVFIHLPGGRSATLAYLKKLNEFSEPYVFHAGRLAELTKDKADAELAAMLNRRLFDPSRPPWVNPQTPQFPAGTQFALVRQMLAIDSTGALVPTRITESVQLRVYLSLDPKRVDGGEQTFAEFVLSRPQLLTSITGGLRAVGRAETGYSLFLAIRSDPLETSSYRPPERLNCMVCHEGMGVHSVLSRAQSTTIIPPELRDTGPEYVSRLAVMWKERQFTWGLLQGFWRNPAR